MASRSDTGFSEELLQRGFDRRLRNLQPICNLLVGKALKDIREDLALGFVRIRNFRFLANRRRTTPLPLCVQLLGTTPQPPAEEHSSSTEDAAELYRSPHCGGPMKIIERFTAA